MAANNHIELVEKTMRILETMASDKGPSDLKNLASRVGLVKSSVFRILYTLRELGYVEQRGRGAYSLTAKMFAVASKTPVRPSLLDVVHPHLARIRDALNEAAWLAEWRRGKVVLIDVADVRHRLRLSLDVGDECPLHAAALGKAIAAYLPPEELAAAWGTADLPRYTSHTVTDRTQVLRELAEVRESGVALNREETIEGAVVVGAPIFDSRGVAFAAISLSCPTARCSAAIRASMVDAVKTASVQISRELNDLGYRAE